jgi:hypothetical protein
MTEIRGQRLVTINWRADMGEETGCTERFLCALFITRGETDL